MPALRPAHRDEGVAVGVGAPRRAGALRRWVAALGLVALLGCGEEAVPSPAAAAPPPTSAGEPFDRDDAPRSAAAGALSSAIPSPPLSVSATPRPAAALAASRVDSGEDLIAPARTLFRVAACGGDAEVPGHLPRSTVEAHCASLATLHGRYRRRWLTGAAAFFAAKRPTNLPSRVVYPFSGGDLSTALTVFPGADEYVTLSLEPAGDVGRVDTILRERLAGALRVSEENLQKLLGISYSSTINLGAGGRAGLPGQLVLFLSALVVHAYEPVKLRYFRIREDGSLAYLSATELARERSRASPPAEGAAAPFANVEIVFKPAGKEGPRKTHRHIAHDLSNASVESDPGLVRYLGSTGPVAAMTKAASHLLWSDDFATLREYLLSHMEWMVSDSTGIPPRFLSGRGFVQEAHGRFWGPSLYGPVNGEDTRGFRALFGDPVPAELPFQFGYPDVKKRSHLVITRRP